MGYKPPEFSPSDNPASDSKSPLTRTLTYLYLPVLNFWLLLFPMSLSFDWSMGAVPLVETVFDARLASILTFYAILAFVVQQLASHLNRTPPTPADGSNSKTKCYNVNGHHHVTEVLEMCYDKQGTSATAFGNGTTRTESIGRHRYIKQSDGDSLEGINEGPSDGRLPMTLSQTAPCSSRDSLDSSSRLHILLVALSFLIFPFIPATNLFFYVGFVIAERVLYIPSMGFCVLVAEAIQFVVARYRKRSVYVISNVVIAGLILSFSLKTVMRNGDWLTDESLYRSGIAINPAKGTSRSF